MSLKPQAQSAPLLVWEQGVRPFLIGLSDALSPRVLLRALTDPAVRRHLRRCVLLNGGVFCGGLLAFTALTHALTAPCGDDCGWLHAALHAQVCLLALAPAYLATLVCNAAWYAQVAANTHALAAAEAKGGAAAAIPAPAPAPAAAASDGGFSLSSLLVAAAEEVYRLAVVLAVTLALAVAALLLPSPLDILLPLPPTALLYGFYLFEYRWAHERTPLEARFACVERRLAYFTGFGLPIALASAAAPVVLDAIAPRAGAVAGAAAGLGVFALVFPFSVVAAAFARVQSVPAAATRVHAFAPARRVAAVVVRALCACAPGQRGGGARRVHDVFAQQQHQHQHQHQQQGGYDAE